MKDGELFSSFLSNFRSYISNVKIMTYQIWSARTETDIGNPLKIKISHG